MDFDTVKENIQPLACGRNVRCLEAALTNKLHHEIAEERQMFEDRINSYEGNDPLEPWFQYITWIEQIYPSAGKESGLEEVLLKCIERFESDERYFQDRRMIRLYIKYIDSQPNPQEYYQELYNQGIGTMVADLYICWAYYYDLLGNFSKADNIFRKGLAARAQPFDELDQAHRHFGFTMSQRILHQDENSQQSFIAKLQERRQALTSLRHHKRKVGSIRTGPAVRSYNPGKVETDPAKPGTSKNVMVQVFEDQNQDPNAILDPHQEESAEGSKSHSIARSIIDSARKQENMREPGPWSKAKAHDHTKCTPVASSSRNLGFDILEDDAEENICPLPTVPNNYIKGIQLGPDHVPHNKPQSDWRVPVCMETEILTHVYPMYQKTLAYPKPGHEYCPEEYRAYKWYKAHGIVNKTVQRLDKVWANDFSIGIRLYPNFADKNKPQPEEETKRFIQDENISSQMRFAININDIYPEDSNEEFQFEEILCRRLKAGQRKLNFGVNNTILMPEEMDETRIVTDAYGRKSVLPSRRSMAARRSTFVAPVPSAAELTESQKVYSVPLKSMNEEPIFANRDTSSRPSEDVEPKQVSSDPKPAEKSPSISCDKKNTEVHKVPEMNFTFKTPAPARKPMALQIYEDEEEESNVACSGPFGVNETCSTQTFNFFIRAQSVSTPKQVRKTLHVELEPASVPVSVPAPVPAPTPPIAPLTPVVVGSPLESPQTYSPEFENPQGSILQKQLSTIMETTETNTVSSGAAVSTKSTVDTQMSSPEFDAENSRNCQPPKSVKCAPETIPEESRENDDSPQRAKCKDLPSPMQQKEDTVSLMMTSLKPFEEKTETVPKVMLAKRSADDFYSLFAKTPEKKGPSFKPRAVGFDIDDSMTVPRKEFTLPKLGDEETQVSLMSQLKLDGQKEESFFSKVKELTLPKLDVEEGVNVGAVENKAECIGRSPFSKKQKFNESIVPGFEDFSTKAKLKMFGFDSPSPQPAVPISIETESLGAATTVTESKPCILQDASQVRLPSFSQPKESILNLSSKQRSVGKPSLLERFQIISNQSVISKPPHEINLSVSASNKRSNYIEEHSMELPNSNVSQIKEEQIQVRTEIEEEKAGASSGLLLRKSTAFGLNKSLKAEKFFKGAPDHQQSCVPALKPDTSTDQLFERFPSTEANSRPPVFRQTRDIGAREVVNTTRPSINLSMQGSRRQSDFFEDNIRTEAFAPNAPGIKNSTWLPNHLTDASQIQEKSIHIKEEPEEDGAWGDTTDLPKKASILSRFSELSKRSSTAPATVRAKNTAVHSPTEMISSPEAMPKPKIDIIPKQEISALIESEKEDCLGRSIYFTKTPKTPMVGRHYWSDDEGESPVQKAQFQSREVDLEHTRQIIDEYLVDHNVNPFEMELTRAFLDQIDFYGHLEQLPTCSIVNKIPALKKGDVITVCESTFEILKISGEGGYGTIFCAKEKRSEKLYALKQEKPPNPWEYYICLELRSRLNNAQIHPCFMDVEYGMIGQNSSVLISSFSKYGSLIAVCNKLKRATSKNMDEYIVMMLTSQLFTIIDHLHASHIIHADIKPDNFLLISKLSYGSNAPVLQLIDFGISIDLALFPPGQTFTYCQKSEDFKCVEMRENRPWTFQVDLFGLAATIHVLLFGKYMEVEKRVTGWTHKSRIPRYFNKVIWDTIFNALLNIRDCNSMPNLQYLRTLLEEEMASKERYLRDKIKEFNLALDGR